MAVRRFVPSFLQRKRGKEVDDGRSLLTRPQFHPLTEHDVVASQQMTGVIAKASGDGYHAVYGIGNRGDKAWRSIVHFSSPEYVDGSKLQLWEAFDWNLDLMLLSRSVHQDLTPMFTHQDELRLRVNDFWVDVLDDTRQYALVTRDEELRVRDLSMWTHSGNVVPKRDEETAALHGRIVRFDELGPFWRQVMHRLPITWEKQEPDLLIMDLETGKGLLNPVVYAAPRKIQWGKWWYAIDSVEVGKRASAFALVRIHVDSLADLQKQPVDLLMRTRHVDKQLYVTAIARMETKVDNLKEPPDFSRTYDRLVEIGQTQMLQDDWVKSAWYWFWPGSPPVPNIKLSQHRVDKPKRALKLLVEPLTPMGDIKGQVVVGRVGRKPLVMDFYKRSGILYEGQPKTGKSELAGFHYGQLGPEFFWFASTAAEFEAAEYFISEMGGTVVKVYLPDSDDLDEQILLIKQDKKDAEAYMLERFQIFEERGKIVRGPYLFRPEELSVRWVAYEDALLGALRKHWQLWFRAERALGAIFVDNLTGLPDEMHDANLGSMPHDKSQDVGAKVRWFVTNGRNYGLVTGTAVHEVGNLDRFSSAFYRSFNLHFRFYENEWTNITILNPKAGEIIAPQVYIRMTKGLDRVYRRRE